MKREAENYITSQDTPESDDEREDGGVFRIAPDSVIKKRIIAPPRSRLNKAQPKNVSGNSPFNFTPAFQQDQKPDSKAGVFNASNLKVSGGFVFNPQPPQNLKAPQEVDTRTNSTSNLSGGFVFNSHTHEKESLLKNESKNTSCVPNFNDRIQALNKSFIGRLGTAFTDDPLVDVSVLFKQYSSYRDVIKKTSVNSGVFIPSIPHIDAVMKAGDSETSTSPTENLKPVFTFGVPKAVESSKPGMSFGNLKNATTSPTIKNAGLPNESPKSGFTFAPAKSVVAASEPTKPVFTFSSSTAGSVVPLNSEVVSPSNTAQMEPLKPGSTFPSIGATPSLTFGGSTSTFSSDTTKPGFIFNNPVKSPAPIEPSKPVFEFTPAAVLPPTTGFSFGGSTSAPTPTIAGAPGFSFGGPKGETPKTGFLFGNATAAPSEPLKPIFSFTSTTAGVTTAAPPEPLKFSFTASTAASAEPPKTGFMLGDKSNFAPKSGFFFGGAANVSEPVDPTKSVFQIAPKPFTLAAPMQFGVQPVNSAAIPFGSGSNVGAAVVDTEEGDSVAPEKQVNLMDGAGQENEDVEFNVPAKLFQFVNSNFLVTGRRIQGCR